MWLATRKGKYPGPLLHVNGSPLASPAFLPGLQVHTFPCLSEEIGTCGAHFLFQLSLEHSENNWLKPASNYVFTRESVFEHGIVMLPRTYLSFRDYYFVHCLFLGIFQANSPLWICCPLLSCPFSCK